MEMAWPFRGDRHPIDGMTALTTAGAGEGFRKRMAQCGIELVVTGESDPRSFVDYTQGAGGTSRRPTITPTTPGGGTRGGRVGRPAARPPAALRQPSWRGC